MKWLRRLFPFRRKLTLKFRGTSTVTVTVTSIDEQAVEAYKKWLLAKLFTPQLAEGPNQYEYNKAMTPEQKREFDKVWPLTEEVWAQVDRVFKAAKPK